MTFIAYLKKLFVRPTKRTVRVERAEEQRKQARLELENAISDLASARARKTRHGI